MTLDSLMSILSNLLQSAWNAQLEMEEINYQMMDSEAARIAAMNPIFQMISAKWRIFKLKYETFFTNFVKKYDT